MSNKSSLEAKNRCYRDIEMELGRWENMKFLHDMDVHGAEYLGEGIVDQEFYMETKKVRGLKALYKLVGLYVPEYHVEGCYAYVVEKYQLGWAAYLADKVAGRVTPGTDEYTKYLWRGIGPKPYFEGLIESYMKFHHRRFRSIDDPSEIEVG